MLSFDFKAARRRQVELEVRGTFDLDMAVKDETQATPIGISISARI